ncbi:MAG TPA: methyltransferase domain-containing protein [Mycobacteriales bacterium]|nr:methyltransferase domain-containing protein [Mycobacteriales bacterium]
MSDLRPTVEDILAAPHRWYHVIDLGGGRSTPGWIDLRGVVDAPGLPKDLNGLRALYVGTFDGFWAFELERRGASVTAIDVDVIPPPDTPASRREKVIEQTGGAVPGTGFRLLKDYFGSAVQRHSLSVYDLTPEAVGGPVDLVFIGAMLLHLRNPVGALERVKETLRPGGRLVLFEPIDRKLSKEKEPLARYRADETLWTWWYPNEACLRAWLATAGFHDVRREGLTDIVDGGGETQLHAALHALA